MTSKTMVGLMCCFLLIFASETSNQRIPKDDEGFRPRPRLKIPT